MILMLAVQVMAADLPNFMISIMILMQYLNIFLSLSSAKYRDYKKFEEAVHIFEPYFF